MYMKFTFVIEYYNYLEQNHYKHFYSSIICAMCLMLLCVHIYSIICVRYFITVCVIKMMLVNVINCIYCDIEKIIFDLI